MFILISDGQAEYPTDEITKIQQLQAAAIESGLRVEYISILIGSSSRDVMEKIKIALNGRHDNIANAANVSSIFR